MAFSTYDFVFLFLPAVLAVYYLLMGFGAYRGAIVALFASSCVFYAWWNPAHIWILLASIAFNYAAGAMLCTHRSRALLIIGLAANVALIVWYKYLLFFGGTIAAIAGRDWVLGQVILPLGISFFTFQQIAWLVDCWSGRVRERNPLDYAFFIAFFPQLISGPIVHHAELVPQVRTAVAGARLSRDIAVGASIFIVGLAKKILIADRLAPFVSYFFAGSADGAEAGAVAAWLAVLAYSLQIYFDFSAYSDMAIGIARMFGFSLPLNFNSPYKSRSIREFWGRWHMTLSRFLRDYLYIPLGGNRRGPFRRGVNLMVTMLLGGLWHGANWTFVLWGGLHGLYLIVHRFWSERSGGLALPAWAGIALTFVLVTLAWVPFRADSLDDAWRIYTQLAGFGGPLVSTGLAEPILYGVPETILRTILQALGATPLASGALCQALLVAGGLAIALCLPNTAETFARAAPLVGEGVPGGTWSVWRPRWKFGAVWLVLIVALFTVSVIFMRRPAPFLYFQF